MQRLSMRWNRYRAYSPPTLAAHCSCNVVYIKMYIECTSRGLRRTSRLRSPRDFMLATCACALHTWCLALCMSGLRSPRVSSSHICKLYVWMSRLRSPRVSSSHVCKLYIWMSRLRSLRVSSSAARSSLSLKASPHSRCAVHGTTDRASEYHSALRCAMRALPCI